MIYVNIYLSCICEYRNICVYINFKKCLLNSHTLCMCMFLCMWIYSYMWVGVHMSVHACLGWTRTAVSSSVTAIHLLWRGAFYWPVRKEYLTREPRESSCLHLSNTVTWCSNLSITMPSIFMWVLKIKYRYSSHRVNTLPTMPPPALKIWILNLYWPSPLLIIIPLKIKKIQYSQINVKGSYNNACCSKS